MSDLVLVDQNEAQGWRVRQDERLDHLFEERCDWINQYGRAGQLAVDAPDLRLTYDELDRRANQLARYLRLRGARAGDRIALLFDRPAPSYVAMLATLKIGATYVPLDTGFPTGRLAYIVEDARVHTVLSQAHVASQVEQIDLLTGSGAELVFVDDAGPLIEEMDSRRLIDAERDVWTNQLAYISYGNVDGRPEGVAIDHTSICNFVKVAAEMYGIRPRTRMYQGLPLALDGAVEEIWVAWQSAATLVPAPPGPALTGVALHRFLTEQRINGLCTVPNVLARLDERQMGDLPDLRFLLMRGKEAPQQLVDRWARPGRRFLNVYGPTEATVTATWSELAPGKPVTIGMPLPTYTTVILDRNDPYRALPHGEVGEIGIAGIGLALGYLNHDDLTEDVFIRDFLDIPANPSGRIYRTGDLGRVNADLEIEYRGRVAPTAEAVSRTEMIDITALVKAGPVVPIQSVAIDTVALERAAKAGAGPSNPLESTYAAVLAEVAHLDLVGLDSHFFDDLGADSLMMAQFCARIRKLPDVPTVSMKDIYRFPTVRSLAAALGEPDSSETERSLAEVLAALIGNQVAVDAHFFDDLGADSLMMAQFCARVRKRVDLPPVSMKDIYAAPSIRKLAIALGEGAGGSSGLGGGAPGSSRQDAAAWTVPVQPVKPVGNVGYWLCGALQVLIFLVVATIGGVALQKGLTYVTSGAGVLKGPGWANDGVGLFGMYLRSVEFTVVAFVAACLLPILVKWILVGRWTPRQIRVWSLDYLRFWAVKTLIRVNPLVLFAGSPIYTWYLRALGAKIGRGTVIHSATVPVCTDLLSIGEDTLIEKTSSFTCYRAHAGLIQIGPVSIGDGVLIGDHTVLDIWTWMGDNAQLGHTSALHAGQGVPPGQTWHGSPAEQADVDYRGVPAAPCGSVRRYGYPLAQLLSLFVLGPLVTLILPLIGTIPLVAARLKDPAAAGTWIFYRDVLVASWVLYLGSLVIGLLLVIIVPRLLWTLITPEKVYSMYGLRYWALRVISRMTNRPGYAWLFGDSSYVVGFLVALGYRLSPIEQTGSNFGMHVKHDVPYLCSAGQGTVVADGLSYLNAEYSTTSFKVSRIDLGANSFLGNQIVYPARAKVGDNCLLGTKVMVPIDGKVRTNVGLLGSPPFEIPRTVERDAAQTQTAEEIAAQLRPKNRHNLVTMAMYLLSRFVYVSILTVLGALVARYQATLGPLVGPMLGPRLGPLVQPLVGPLVVAVYVALPPLLALVYFVPLDRLFARSMSWVPDGVSIYDPAFWRHERFWKVPAAKYVQLYNGTPFKGLAWRLLGVRIGGRVFDDGCSIIERRFTTIGYDCTLNAGSIIQCHSQEDGAFKSDIVTLGAGVTVGVGAFVHYGVTIGDGVVLEADSFLMKGEEVPAYSRWGGNPAEEIQGQPVVGVAVTPELTAARSAA